MWNGYFLFVLLAVVGLYLVDLWSSLLNLRALRGELPAEFHDVFDADRYAQAQRYARAATHFELADSGCSLVVFLAFWWLGGFGWLDHIVRQATAVPLVRGLVFIAVLYLGAQLVRLPFAIYDTFVLEERFGFNRTTPGTFVADQLMTLGLTCLLGGAVLAVILLLFDWLGPAAWLAAWVVLALVTLAMAYLGPQIILPLFHKLRPLPGGELKTAIQQMSQECGFPLREVYEIDGSRRTSKSNAFFTGFGRNKRIALYDTLIQNHTAGELVAVLAHEIGHYKKHHVIQRLLLGIAQMGILFFVLGFFMNNQGLHEAFGVRETSVYCSLVLFFFLYEPLSKLLGLGTLLLSRRNEFEADAYAARVTGRPEHLVAGLKKLSKDNLTNLTPHPVYVFLNYSHPPVLARISALRKHQMTSTK
jgi:STE24 endopeptidase